MRDHSRQPQIASSHNSRRSPSKLTPIEEILEIFVRVNSGGLVLLKSDLLMRLLDLKSNDIQPMSCKSWYAISMPADRFHFRETTFSRACYWRRVQRPDLTDL